ncbi:MAG: alpha/beta hydrolase [Bryobacterales bacterium]|nr:alpha/beta hydrolase [Bryobacteraceae bacterium]MDW8356042.1 alpha/beta hydrolase [Bryobacterales bacterium]
MQRAALVFLLAAAGGWAQPFRDPPAIPDWVAVDANLRYDQYPETVLDVLQPKAAATARRPGVIVIHGGGWVRGSREMMINGFCIPYLQQGFVVANVGYRLAKTAPAPAAVTDVLNAAQWFLRNAARYNVDRNRVVVTGASAGGHLALMVGLTPKGARLGPPAKVAAVVNIYGITDVADQIQGPNQRPYALEWIPDQPGRLELARRLSPITYVRRDVPPVLTIHGDADETVPYEHGVKLTKALRDAGADAELIPVPQGGHVFTKEQWDALLPQIFAFLKQRRIL